MSYCEGDHLPGCCHACGAQACLNCRTRIEPELNWEKTTYVIGDCTLCSPSPEPMTNRELLLRLRDAAKALSDAATHCRSCRDCGDGPCCVDCIEDTSTLQLVDQLLREPVAKD